MRANGQPQQQQNEWFCTKNMWKKYESWKHKLCIWFMADKTLYCLTKIRNKINALFPFSAHSFSLGFRFVFFYFQISERNICVQWIHNATLCCPVYKAQTPVIIKYDQHELYIYFVYLFWFLVDRTRHTHTPNERTEKKNSRKREKNKFSVHFLWVTVARALRIKAYQFIIDFVFSRNILLLRNVCIHLEFELDLCVA